MLSSQLWIRHVTWKSRSYTRLCHHLSFECKSTKEEEGEPKNNRNGRHWENCKPGLTSIELALSSMFPFLQLLDPLPSYSHTHSQGHIPKCRLFSLLRQMCKPRRKGKEHPKTIGMGGIRKTQNPNLLLRKYKAHAFLHVPIPTALGPSHSSSSLAHHLNLKS